RRDGFALSDDCSDCSQIIGQFYQYMTVRARNRYYQRSITELLQLGNDCLPRCRTLVFGDHDGRTTDSFAVSVQARVFSRRWWILVVSRGVDFVLARAESAWVAGEPAVHGRNHHMAPAHSGFRHGSPLRLDPEGSLHSPSGLIQSSRERKPEGEWSEPSGFNP